MSTLLDTARAAIPGQAALERALTAVKEREESFVIRPEADLHDEALAAVLAGDPVPDDLGARIAAVREANVAVALERTALQQIRGSLHDRRRRAHVDGADHALGFLADTLDQLLTDARPAFEVLGSITSAEEVIDTGSEAVTAWSTAGTLADQYVELRTAQAVVVSAAIAPPDQVSTVVTTAGKATRRLVSTFGTVRNFAALYPDLDGFDPADDDAPVGVTSTRIQDGLVVEAGSSSHPIGTVPWLTDDPLTALRSMLVPEVEPWVPTIDELTTIRDEALDRRAAARRGEDVPSLAMSEQAADRRKRKHLGPGQAAERLIGAQP